MFPWREVHDVQQCLCRWDMDNVQGLPAEHVQRVTAPAGLPSSESTSWYHLFPSSWPHDVNENIIQQIRMPYPSPQAPLLMLTFPFEAPSAVSGVIMGALTGLWRHSPKCVFSQLLCFCLIRTAQMNPWPSAERETVWNNRSLRCKMKVKWLKHDYCIFRDVTINENIFWSFELCILLLILNVTLLNFFCEQSRKQKVIWSDYIRFE